MHRPARSTVPISTGGNGSRSSGLTFSAGERYNVSQPYLLSVRKAAEYIGRTEKAVRHLYEKRVFTPLRIDGRVFIDRREIDAKYEQARCEVS